MHSAAGECGVAKVAMELQNEGKFIVPSDTAIRSFSFAITNDGSTPTRGEFTIVRDVDENSASLHQIMGRELYGLSVYSYDGSDLATATKSYFVLMSNPRISSISTYVDEKTGWPVEKVTFASYTHLTVESKKGSVRNKSEYAFSRSSSTS